MGQEALAPLRAEAERLLRSSPPPARYREVLTVLGLGHALSLRGEVLEEQYDTLLAGLLSQWVQPIQDRLRRLLASLPEARREALLLRSGAAQRGYADLCP